MSDISKKITTINDGDHIVIEEGEGIRIRKSMGIFYHKCCKCGIMHRITIVNNKSSGLVIRWYTVDDPDAQQN